MSMNKGRHALSHMLVAGTTLWCLYHTDKSGGWRWIYGTYGTLCAYSFIGTWRYGNPRYGDDAVQLYDFSHMCLMAFALPCTVIELYLHYRIAFEYAIVHVILPLIPLGVYLTQTEWEQDLCDLLVIGNAISCIYISVTQQNYYGIITAVNYLVTHFILKNQDFSEVPRKVFYNIGLCFFAFYALRAINEASGVGIKL